MFYCLCNNGSTTDFGLYSSEFETTGGTRYTIWITIAIHAIFWGIFTPRVGRFSDRLGGYVVIIPVDLFYRNAIDGK